MERTLFQKRHYAILADVMTRLRQKHGTPSAFHGHAADALDDLQRELVELFAADNPRFNRKTFEEACRP